MEETTSEQNKDPLLRSSEEDVEEPSESSEKIDVNGVIIHKNEHSSKQQPLVEKSENRKRKTADITKVVIRHIPKHLKKEEFLEAIGPLPPYNYLSYTTGVFLSRLWNRKSTGFCTVNFVTQEDAFQFVTDHRLFVIRDDKGDEHYAATEFAVNQRIPKATYSNSAGGDDTIETLFEDGADALFDDDGDALFDNAEDPLNNLENDPNYIQFKNVYEASTTGVIGTTVNADGSTIDAMVKEIEERSAQKNTLQMTPLLNFVFAQTNLQKENKRRREASKKSDKVVKKIIKIKKLKSRIDDANREPSSHAHVTNADVKDSSGTKPSSAGKGGSKSSSSNPSKGRGGNPVEGTRGSSNQTQPEQRRSNNNNNNQAAQKEKRLAQASKKTDKGVKKIMKIKKVKSKTDDGSGEPSAHANVTNVDGKDSTVTPVTKPSSAGKGPSKSSSSNPKSSSGSVNLVEGTGGNSNQTQPEQRSSNNNNNQAAQKEKRLAQASKKPDKVVKKIIKIKKVKSKTDDASGEPSSHTNADGKDSSVTKPSSASKGERSSSNAAKSSSSVNPVDGTRGNSNQTQPEQRSSNSNNNQAAQNESKGDSNRSRKARPDQAIYRPGAGSLKSRRPGGSSSATSSTSSKKTKD